MLNEAEGLGAQFSRENPIMVVEEGLGVYDAITLFQALAFVLTRYGC